MQLFPSHTCFLVFALPAHPRREHPFDVWARATRPERRERQLMLDQQSRQALIFPETAWLL
jgi:hypothetical protein